MAKHLRRVSGARRLGRTAVTVLTAGSLLTAGAAAFADTGSVDGDTGTSGGNAVVSTTGECAGDGVPGSVTLTYNGSDHFTAGEDLTFTFFTPTGITVDAPVSPKVPSGTSWNSNGDSQTYTFATHVASTVYDDTYSVGVKVAGASYAVGASEGSGRPKFNVQVSCGRTAPVGKATRTLTLTAGSPLTYGQTETLSATPSAGGGAITYELLSGPCTLTGADLTANSGTGSCDVKATIAEDASYLSASDTKTVSLAKANQTITFDATNPSTKTYGDAAFTMAASSDSGLAVVLASATTGVCTISGSTVTIVHAGTCTITADQAGNDDYNAAQQQSASVTIGKATLDVTSPSATAVVNQPTLPALNPVYGAFQYSDTAGDLDTAPTCSTTVSDASTPGVFAVTCSGGSDGDYDFNYINTGTLTVDYRYSGFMQPINVDRSSRFKYGSTIPVKFQLLDYYGVPQNVPGRNYVIRATKVDSTAGGDINESTNAATGDTSKSFRWDSSGLLYIYNLSTKLTGMTGDATYKVEALYNSSPVVTGYVDIKK